MEQIKLSYSGPLRRVKVAVMPIHCKKGDKLALEMIRRAKSKCEAEKAAGRINIYHVFESDFLKLWREMQDSDDVPENTWVNFTLAQGGLKINGIDLKADSGESALKLTANLDPSEEKLLSWANFQLNIQQILLEQKITAIPHEAMMRSAYLLIKNGRKLNDWLIKSVADSSENKGKKLAFTMNSERREVYLYLGDKSLFHSENVVRDILSRVESVLIKIKEKFPDAVFLKEDLVRTLQMMNKGPEQFGLYLPKTILLAMPEQASAISTSQEKLQSPSAVSAGANNRPVERKNATKKSVNDQVNSAKKNRKNRGNWLFKFDIDEFGMVAKIKDVNEYQLYKKSGEIFTREAMLKELHKVGIKAGYEPYLEKILNVIALEGQLLEQVVARGEAAVPGEIPYVHLVYLDQDPDRADVLIEDVRSAQNKGIVQKGDIIAEIRYRDGKAGFDVFGEYTHILGHESLLNLTIGAGITKVKEGQFQAEVDGMPLIDDKKIECSPVYIHKGDVNLTTGNVIFVGSAEIHGNIESGSTVIVTGHLVVKGTIGRAFVRCGGDLKVKGGILAGDAGWVEAGGNMFAEFIENSRVVVSGNLDVRTSIMNSSVIVGDSLCMKDLKEGTVGGGHVSVRNLLHTAHLGFADGKKTVCRIGADYLLERRITIQELRMNSLEKAQEVEKRNVEELQGKKFRNAEQNKLLESKTKRVQRIGMIMRKIERKIGTLSKLVSWNRNAIVKVEDLVVKNIDLIVGGKPIVINDDMRSVLITYHRYRDSRINPLEALEAYQKARLVAPLAS